MISASTASTAQRRARFTAGEPSTPPLTSLREGITLQTFGKDKYGRIIPQVLLPDGTTVDHESVKEGKCWRA